MPTWFWWGNLRERNQLKDIGAGGRIILKWNFKKFDGDMDWIYLDPDGIRWWAFVKAVMNVWVP